MTNISNIYIYEKDLKGPEGFLKKVLKKYNLWNEFQHDGSFNEMLVETILREVGECTYKAQCSVDLFLKNLNNSAIVSWFVPNFETFGVLEYEYEDFTCSKTTENHVVKSLESSEAELSNMLLPSLDCTYNSDISCQISEGSLSK